MHIRISNRESVKPRRTSAHKHTETTNTTWQNKSTYNKLCGRPPQYAPPPVSWPLTLESRVRVKCDVGYLCANFSLPGPRWSRVRPDVRTRQTDSIMA